MIIRNNIPNIFKVINILEIYNILKTLRLINIIFYICIPTSLRDIDSNISSIYIHNCVYELWPGYIHLTYIHSYPGSPYYGQLEYIS